MSTLPAETNGGVPARDGYAKPGADVQADIQPERQPRIEREQQPTGKAPESASGADRGPDLPFTGYDIGLLVVSALFLAALGAAFRWISRA